MKMKKVFISILASLLLLVGCEDNQDFHMKQQIRDVDKVRISDLNIERIEMVITEDDSTNTIMLFMNLYLYTEEYHLEKVNPDDEIMLRCILPKEINQLTGFSSTDLNFNLSNDGVGPQTFGGLGFEKSEEKLNVIKEYTTYTLELYVNDTYVETQEVEVELKEYKKSRD